MNNNNNNSNGNQMRWEGGRRPSVARRRRLVGVPAAVRGWIFENNNNNNNNKENKEKNGEWKKKDGNEMRGCLADSVWGAGEGGLLGERKMEGKKGKTRGENRGGSAAIREWRGKDERKMKGSWELLPRVQCRAKKTKKKKKKGKMGEPAVSRVPQKNEEEKIRG